VCFYVLFECFHDRMKYFLFLFSLAFWFFSALLKGVFRKTMVDLKSCDIENSVPNSSLTYNTRSIKELVVALRGPLSNLCK
jgi:hypothetical protein